VPRAASGEKRSSSAKRGSAEKGVAMLIRKIEVFLRQTRMPPTRFGRMAAHDPRFVFDLRNGRSPRPRTEERVEHFMNEYQDHSHAH
jgi:hypothetical protein